MTKQPGSTNYTVSEQRRLIEIVRSVVPTDRDGWTAVAAAYNAHKAAGGKARDAVSLKRKFARMHRENNHSPTRRTDTDLVRGAGQLRAKGVQLILEGNMRRSAQALKEPLQLLPGSEEAPSESKLRGGDAEDSLALASQQAATYKKRESDGTPYLQPSTADSDCNMPASTRIDHGHDGASRSGRSGLGVGSASRARRDHTDKASTDRSELSGAVDPQNLLAPGQLAHHPGGTHRQHHLSDLRHQFKRYRQTARRHHKELLAYMAALATAVDKTSYRRQETQIP